MNTSNHDIDTQTAKALFLRISKLALLFMAAFLAGNTAARLQEHFSLETTSPGHVIDFSEGNWGLSFQEEGQPPVANATAQELAQYNAYYADMTEDKVLYLTFDAGFENGNTPAILDALKKHNAPATFLWSAPISLPIRI